MNKIIALLLVLSMLFAFAACGGNKEKLPTVKNTEVTRGTTENINNTYDKESETQGTIEGATGDNTADSTEPYDTPPATTKPATTKPATTTPATTKPATTKPATTTPATTKPVTTTPVTTTPTTTESATTTPATTKPVTTTPATTEPTTTTSVTESAVTPPDTSELEKQIFIQLYRHEEAEYQLGQLSLSKEISSLEAELSSLKQEASENYIRYMQEKQQITNKFEAMGMLNSGAYESALKTNEDNYKALSKSLTEYIDALESQIVALKAEQSDPSVNNILKQLAKNNNMSYEDAVEKYNKYMG